MSAAFTIALLATYAGMWWMAAVYEPERPTCRCTDCEAGR